ncbi:thermosome subunit alpha [Schleiferiaceae bacterium]|nr:thermosome subunit alpha [Schleiferiaceae bacterium]
MTMQPANNGQQPVYIMQKGTEQTNGSAAQRSNIQAAKAVGAAIKTTLGPLGMDKMLIDPTGNVLITNDGVSILREIGIEHPAAKMIVEVAKTQEAQCFDGTTSAVVLSGALLEEAERLLDKGIHPTTICKGFRIAKDFCLNELEYVSKTNMEWAKDDLDHVNLSYLAAYSSLTGKSAESIQDKLASMAQKVISQVNSIEDIRYISASGTNENDTYSLPGIVIERDLASQTMKRTHEKANILLLDCAIEPKKTNIDAQVQITNPAQVEEFLRQEEDAIRDMVELIHQSGANVVLTQKKIDDLALHYLKKHGITAIHSVKKSDLDSASRISKASIVSSLSNPIDDFDLGKCSFHVTNAFDHDLVLITNPDNSPIQTIIACGATSHVAEEVERALEDCVGVAWLMKAQEGFLLGGGATQAYLYNALKNYCRPEGRVQMAVDAYAEALLQIPSAIAENAGLDPVDELLALCKNNADGDLAYFIDVEPESKENPHNAAKQGIIEPTALHVQALTSATEAAVMVLRIDDVIRMNPSPGGPPMPPM